MLQVEIYEDNDNARKDEISALGGQTASGTNLFSAFYDRLKEVSCGCGKLNDANRLMYGKYVQSYVCLLVEMNWCEFESRSHWRFYMHCKVVLCQLGDSCLYTLNFMISAIYSNLKLCKLISVLWY